MPRPIVIVFSIQITLRFLFLFPKLCVWGIERPRYAVQGPVRDTTEPLTFLVMCSFDLSSEDKAEREKDNIVSVSDR